MKFWVLVVFLGITSLMAGEIPSESTAPLTLSQCYALALERSETIGLTQEDVALAEAQYEQVRAAVLPQAGFLFTDKFQDIGGSSGSSLRRETPQAGFYGHQLLFAGFREFAAMKGQKHQIQSRARDVDQARLLLYEDVARVFFTVAANDLEIKSLETLIRLSQDRVGELRKRVAVGRSRDSEILSTESQWANLEARRQAAQGYRASALEVLSFLIGQRVSGVQDDFPETVLPPPLERYLSQTPSRPDVQSVLSQRESRRLFSLAARRSYWPTLNLDGNYYTQRVGANESVDWDLFLVLDVPFYKGGETQADARTAKSLERSVALRWSQVQRTAEREVRERYQNVLSYVAQVEKLERSASLAQKNYEMQRREYTMGLVSNLEVLAALNTWQEASSAWERTRLQSKNAAVLLELAVGRTPGENP